MLKQMNVFNRYFVKYRWWIVAMSALFVAIAIIATRDLPVPSLYESRYELRIIKINDEMNSFDVISDCKDSLWGCGENVDVYCDKLGDIIIRVRHSNPDSAQMIANMLYQELAERIGRYVSVACDKQLKIYRASYDALADLPATDSVVAHRAILMEEMAQMASYSEFKTKGVVVINSVNAGVPQRTLNRWLLVVLSSVSFILLCVLFVFLKSLEYNVRTNEVCK